VKWCIKTAHLPSLLGSLCFLAGLLAFEARGDEAALSPQIFEQPANQHASSEPKFAPQVKLPVSVALLDKVIVESPRIYFSSLGVCTGTRSLCEEMGGVDLGAGPRPGSVKFLTQDQVMQVLAVEFPNAEITWSGAKKITLNGSFQELTAETIQSALVAALQASLKDKSNIQIDAEVRLAKGIKVVPGEYQIKFPFTESANTEHLEWIITHYVGSRTVEVLYFPEDDPDSKQSFKVAAQITAKIQVPVAKLDLPRGSIIEHSYLEYTWVPLRLSSAHVFRELADLVGKKVEQGVQAGQAIMNKQVAAPILVKRGDPVNILIHRGELVVRGRGKALMSGGKGQMIPVVYPSTKKQVQARVSDVGTVEVAF